MKKIIFLILISFSSFAQKDKNELTETINTFFEGLNKKDTSLLSRVIYEDCSLNTVLIKADNNSELKKEEIANFLKSIGSIPAGMKIEERILSIELMQDEALASAWVPYEFYVNDKFSHKGTNLITLVKTNDFWKITAIIDTRKK
jgi:hypothetical protein